MRTPCIVILALVCITAEVHGEAVKSLRLILPPQPSPVVQNIGRVFVRQIESRCDAKVAKEDDAPLTVELTIKPGIGDEGFKIADGPKGTVRIIGNDTRGVLYGVGRFLHTSSYGSQGFTPGTWRGVSVPRMPVRGIYLATYFQNYYRVAPVEDVTRSWASASGTCATGGRTWRDPRGRCRRFAPRRSPNWRSRTNDCARRTRACAISATF